MPDLLLSYNNRQRQVNQQTESKQVLSQHTEHSPRTSRHKASEAAPGLSCAARFERLAGVFANRAASLHLNPHYRHPQDSTSVLSLLIIRQGENSTILQTPMIQQSTNTIRDFTAGFSAGKTHQHQRWQIRQPALHSRQHSAS